MTRPPVLQVREWSTTTPDTPGSGALLRDVRLSVADRELLAELVDRASLRVTEFARGLSISVGPHIGTVNLSSIRIVILPKLRLDNLMRMVAYAFDLSDLLVTETRTTYESAEHGLIDLLGVSLLRAVERIVRGGLLPTYQSRHEDLATPRGRLDLRHIATHPRRATLRLGLVRRPHRRPRVEPGRGRRSSPSRLGDGVARSAARSCAQRTAFSATSNVALLVRTGWKRYSPG